MIKQLNTINGSQIFNSTLNGVNYNFRIIWRGTEYVLDLLDTNKNPIIQGIALVTGMDLLSPYKYLNLGFGLFVSNSANPMQDMTYKDLSNTHQILVFN